MADGQNNMNITPAYLWTAFRAWWRGLGVGIRLVLGIAFVGLIGVVWAALSPFSTGPILGTTIQDAVLLFQPSSGTFQHDAIVPVDVRLENPSGQNVGAVTAVITYENAFFELTENDCVSSTDAACVNTVTSSFAQNLQQTMVTGPNTNTLTISRGRSTTQGWLTDATGVVATLRFRVKSKNNPTAPTNIGATTVNINITASQVGVPVSSGSVVCSDGINKGNACTAANPDCPIHPPTTPFYCEILIPGAGKCQVPMTDRSCLVNEDCQEYASCAAEIHSENILETVQDATYTIGGFSCADLGGTVCGSGQKVCSNDPTKTCDNNIDCPISPPGVAKCKSGTGIRTCENNINIQCTDDSDCVEYGVCAAAAGSICRGTEYPDIDLTTVCCSQACTPIEAGKLYIQNVTVNAAPLGGGSARADFSWSVFPPQAGQTTCTISITGPGITAPSPTTANVNHNQSASISGLTAATQTYSYNIHCTASGGYDPADTPGTFQVSGSTAGALTIGNLSVGNITFTKAHVSFTTSVQAQGSVAFGEKSATGGCAGASYGGGAPTGPATSHGADITFSSAPNDRVMCVRVTASAAGLPSAGPIFREFVVPAQVGLVPDANVVMKVTKDRICRNWLYCQSAVRLRNAQGKNEDLCFDLGLCDALDEAGQCANPIGVADALGSGVLTFAAPGEVQRIADMTGAVKAGLNWGNDASGNPRVIEGWYPYVNMSETGNTVQVPNGNFESGSAAPWRSAVNGGSVYVYPNTGDSLNPSYVAKVVPTARTFTGAQVPIGIIYSSLEPMNLTFKAKTDRADRSSAKKIQVQIGATPAGPATTYYNFVAAGSALLELSPQWETYQMQLGRTVGASPLPQNFSENVVLQFVQPESSAASPEAFYIDDIAIQPVLAVAPGTTLPRQCRLYPKAGAPACDFLELASGSEYRGWKGYCIERKDPDPNLANDPKNDCIIWWPVDVLEGSADLFTGEEVVGYKGRKPLYYCLESKGDWPYYDRAVSGRQEYYGNGPGSGDSWFIDVTNLDIHRDEIIEVRVNGVQMEDDDRNEWECRIDMGSGTPSYTVGDGNGNTGYLVMNAANKEHWTDGFATRKAGADGGGDAYYNNYAWFYCGNHGRDDDTNVMTMRLEINPVTEILQQVQVRFVAAGQGSDGAKFDSVTINYRGERCNVIAQVVNTSGDAVPWTSRVTPGGWSRDNRLNYSYDQDFAPYGGLVLPGGEGVDPGLPETWPGAAYVEAPLASLGQKSPYQYRAGAPYGARFVSGVAPTTGGQVCITGSTDRLGKPCSKDENCGFVGAGNTNTPGTCAGIARPGSPLFSWSTYYAALTPAAGDPPAARGRDNLGFLFNRAFGVWAWGYDPGTGKYQYRKCDGLNNPPNIGCIEPWDFRGLAVNAAQAPQIYDIVVEGPPIIKRAGGVILKFTSAVNGDHLPLVSYRIDWGDGSPVTEVSGLRVNARPSLANPHIALHSYQCTGGAVCNYKPSVQVTDNWGWCNGQIGSSSGFYGSACAVAAQPLSTSPQPWAIYLGTVTVQP